MSTSRDKPNLFLSSSQWVAIANHWRIMPATIRITRRINRTSKILVSVFIDALFVGSLIVPWSHFPSIVEDKDENDDSDDQCCGRNDYLGFLLHFILIHCLEEYKYAPLLDSAPHLPSELSESVTKWWAERNLGPQFRLAWDRNCPKVGNSPWRSVWKIELNLFPSFFS